MTDPAEIRAEGRRLAEEVGPVAFKEYLDWLYDNADVLLADPAPEPAEPGALTTTFHERTARRHDNGDHVVEFPFLGCAYCEMEHPKGRYATLLADPDPVGLTEDERRHIGRVREKYALWGRAEAQAQADPDDFKASDAADDLLSSVSDEWVIALPHFFTALDRLSAAPVDDREREGEVIDNVRAFLTEIVQSNPPHPDAAFEMVQSLAKVHLRALAERPVSPSVDPEEKP